MGGIASIRGTPVHGAGGPSSPMGVSSGPYHEPDIIRCIYPPFQSGEQRGFLRGRAAGSTFALKVGITRPVIRSLASAVTRSPVGVAMPVRFRTAVTRHPASMTRAKPKTIS